ncbi:MAG: hypothetical protein Q8L51_02250 [Candidatus Amesbacteria bacterium]|nr:hypothetical protein [Candidatus Amesbacteria bacterium]
MSVEQELIEVLGQLAPYKQRHHSEVAKARKLLMKEFGKIRKWLDANSYIITIHGSLQYWDPHNLDADVAIISNTMSHEHMKYLWDFENKIDDKWPWKGKGDYTEMELTKINEEGEYADLLLSFVLSSDLLWKNQASVFQEYQRIALNIFSSDNTLAIATLTTLYDTLKIRKERAGV